MRIPPPTIQPRDLFQQSGLQQPGAGNSRNVADVLGNAALARSGAVGATSSAGSAAASTFDAGATARNILDMVSSQLAEAVSRGASPQELSRLLQQAREGAQTGFDAAIEQLKNMGEIDAGLSSGISSALQLVDKGFDELARQLGIAAPSSGDSKTAPSATLGELASDYGQRFASGQSADLTVRTADGDTVRLRISADSATGADGSVRSSGGVTMEVEGQLDADETKALNELVDRVGKLADTFFGGDMESALQQANALEFENPELDSMSLTLRRSVSAYQDVQSLGSDALADYAAMDNGAVVGDTTGGGAVPSVKAQLAQQLTALLPEASLSENPAGTLKELLAAQVAAKGQEDSPLLGFANRLLDAMGASRPPA